MGNYEGLIKMGIGLIVFIGGIYAVYFRLKYLVERLAEKMEEAEKTIKDERKKREEDMQRLTSTLQNDLKDEEHFLQGLLKDHKDYFTRIWKSLEDIGKQITQVTERLDGHIRNQEKICKLNHNRNN